ncbi:MAG: hypothetical protein WBJ10_00030 [Daejeonella sp.]|uniref:hypothetical protein n=1 Tax=Daejeonella sp. TaxID=2805397 RepID=UPI003C77E2B0
MTFEEFITRKKIDLARFKTAEPGLFSEFQSHYSQMGEKSFDHSKKFLFNKLRRAYHLKEEPKPAVVSQAPEINKIASQAEPLLSPTIEATVYTPRFRAGGTAKPAEGKEATSPEKTPKPAYTPRFKAPAVKSPENIPDPDVPAQTSDLRPPTSDLLPTEKPKPAYVPRFKAPASKPAEETKEEIPTDKPKPAYVPRFKAPIKPAPDTTNEDTPGDR